MFAKVILRVIVILFNIFRSIIYMSTIKIIIRYVIAYKIVTIKYCKPDMFRGKKRFRFFRGRGPTAKLFFREIFWPIL